MRRVQLQKCPVRNKEHKKDRELRNESAKLKNNEGRMRTRKTTMVAGNRKKRMGGWGWEGFRNL